MALTFNPPFTQIPNVGCVALAAANTARDGSGTIATAFTAGADGAYIKKIRFTPAQATAAAIGAKVFCVFYSSDAGTTWNFLQEIAIATSTPSNTAVGTSAIIAFPDGLVIPANTLIGVTQTVYAGAQDRTQVIVEGSNY